MINRPSYAERTLEHTRSSLQTMPPSVRRISILGDDAPMGVLVDLQRWRRKSATTR